ncbi:Nuclear transcription factor Y subunit C-1 [Acorus calamus]|uniref:Nuclear transcription factor Y subunit C-1 n=1 Tax=Acorus calamus TaxID=4465 RepID=A0AAV9E1C8_ACOCL|nr:Nuclear transcription factor Y subunit C-1 [Acorus calamus]
MENHHHHHHQPPPPPPPQQPYPPSQTSPTTTSSSFHHLLQQQHQQLQMFWNYQRQEIETVSDFKNHQLPLARIKKIMKADEDVRMISAEAPILFAKACELFILELTIRSWLHAEENKRRTLQKNDIAAAITRTDIFDFLVDIVPRDDNVKEEAVVGAAAAAGVPYYYPPMGAAAGVMMGQPAMQPWQTMWQAEERAAAVGYDDGGMSLVIHELL